MPSTDLQTRVILSAEDRGITYLMNRLKTESDLFIDKFSQLGGVISSALGNIGVGYGIKKAMEQIDTLRMDVNNVAVMLTDTVKGTSQEIQQAFQQNQKHAEAFFRLLRRQANESISDFADLRRAYTIMAANGMGVEATPEGLRMLANVVDRIKLATTGQKSNYQIMQEMRALMRGTLKPSDETARMFQNRDANFSTTIKRLVAGRDSKAILEYLNSLLADIDLSSVVRRSMSKQIGRVKTEMAFWAEDAFSPMYDVFVSMMSDLADNVMSRDNPFFKGLDATADAATKMLMRVRDGVKSIDFKERAKEGTNWTAVMAESLPKLAAIALTAKTAAVSFGLLAGAVKSSIAAMNTIPGFITAGAMGYTIASQYAATGDVPRYADYGRELTTEDRLDEFKFGLGILLETVKEFGKSLLSYIMEVGSWFTNSIRGIAQGVMNMFDRLIFYARAALDAIGMKFNIDSLKGAEFEERRANKRNDVENEIRRIADRARNFPLFGDDRTMHLLGLKRDMDTYYDGDASELLKMMRSYTTPGLFKNKKDVEQAFKILGIDQAALDYLSEGYKKEQVYNYVPRENPYFFEAEKAFNRMEDVENEMSKSFGRALDNYEAKWNARINARGAKQEAAIAPNAVTGLINAQGMSGSAAASDGARRFQRMADEIGKLTGAISQLTGGPSDGAGKAVEGALGKYKSIQRMIESMTPDLSGLPESYRAYASMATAMEDAQNELKRTMDAAAKADLTERIDGLARKMLAAEGDVAKDLAAMRESKLGEAQRMLAETMREAEAEARRAYAVKEADKAEQSYFSLAGSGQGQLMQRIRELSGSDTLETEAEAVRRKLDYEEKYNTLREKEIEYLKEQERLMSSGSFFDAIKFSVNEYVHDAQTSFNAMVEFANDAGQAIQSTFSDSLYHVFRGDLKSMKDIFASFCDSLLKSWTDMLAKMVVQQAANGLTSSVFGNLLNGFIGGIFGGGAGLGGLASAGGGSIGAGSTMLMQTMPLMANGGVLRGGFRAFAGGGIATRPTFGLVGEGRYNEAVVPLPDGRSIPVIQKGGGANVIVNITDKSGSATSKTVNQRTDETGATVLDVVIDAIGSNRKNFRNILRSVNA